LNELFAGIEQDKTQKMKDTVDKVAKVIGNPRNYGPTAEEKAEMEKIAQEERLRLEAKQRKEREQQEAEEAAETARKRGEWVSIPVKCNTSYAEQRHRLGSMQAARQQSNDN
jgi:hypothetical protein